MTDWVIAADGGNSKTDLVLASCEGTVLARVRGAGTRSPLDAEYPTTSTLAGLVREAKRQAGIPHDSIAVAGVYYLANLDIPSEEREMAKRLAALGLSERLEVGNDTLAVVKAGELRGWGVAVVAGTGINALGVGPDGRVERFLSFGELSGDWGGGGHIARMGLYQAIRDQDGRGRPTMLRQTIPAFFGEVEPSDLAIAVHRGEIPTSRLIDACPVVFAAAQDGDAVAREIVERNGRECAIMAGALISRLCTPPRQTPVVLGGSTLQCRDPVEFAAFADELERRAPGASFTVLDVPPVAGAVSEALAVSGASSAAVRAVRRALR